MPERFLLRSLLSIVLSVCILIACSGGNSSDIPNARFLVGKVVTADGTPVRGVLVDIYENTSSFAPAQKASSLYPAYTDRDGRYRLELPRYIESVNILFQAKNGFSNLRMNVVVPDTGTIELMADTVRPAGSIRGISFMHGLDSLNQVRVTIYIPGTPFMTKPDVGGLFALNGIPPGIYRVIIDPAYLEYRVTLRDNVLVKARDTLDLGTIRINKETE